MRRLGCYLLLAAFSACLCSSQAQEKPRLRSMHLAGQTATVIEEAFQLYGVSVTFVKPIRGLEQPLELDLKDADLATTSAVLDLLARCFFVPVNAHAVLAVQDDREHRSDYERLFFRGNQEFVSSLSVPPGVTTLVVSNLSKTEARTVEGFARLMPTGSSLNQQTSQLVVTLTPHLIAKR